MSRETAKQFIDLLEHDAPLQTQFMIASPNTLEGVVDFADTKGYLFTTDELEAALKEMPHSRIAQELRQRIR
jgi:predicted ribosomally synthesized peptide with nif11-like leader